METPKLSTDKALQEIYDRISKSQYVPYRTSNSHRVRTINEKIDEEAREKKLKNDGLAQDTKLKKYTLFILFAFLAAETIAIFVISFFQGFMFKFFFLEEWSFRILVVSTILQITAMLTIAVRHLFPNK